MAEGKRIFVHAGAHRTGTSSFQMCLALNRATLEGAGFDLAYPGRDGAPDGTLGLRLPRPRHGRAKQAMFVEKAAATLAEHSPDPARALILSEENIPGSMIHFRKGKFYPAARQRFGALRQGMGVNPAHLILVVREYAQLFQSAYRKRAEDTLEVPFDATLPALQKMRKGWPELAKIMRNVMMPERMTVIRYEARGQSVDLLRRLVPGLDDMALKEPEQIVNLSATDAALEALQARYRAGETLTREAWQDIVETHADDKADRGFARFPKDIADILEARYETDLTRLAELDGVDFV